MAVKISELPAGTIPLSGGELFEMVQNGESYSVPVSGFAGLNHNTLSNIQGGIPSASEYYHLSQLIHDSLFSASPTIGVGINGALGGNEANLQVDYGNDNISFYMDAGGGQGYKQVIDIDGSAGNSEINLGLQTEVYQKITIGSGPNIRMMSGTDEWFYVDADNQRLGNDAAGGSYIEFDSGAAEAEIYTQGVRMYWSNQEEVKLGDMDGDATVTYIHVNADNSVMNFYVHDAGSILELDNESITLGISGNNIWQDFNTGDFIHYASFGGPQFPMIHYDQSSAYLKLGNQDHTYIYIREMDDPGDGSIRLYAADTVQLNPGNEVVIDIGGGVNEFTVDSAGVTLTKGVTVDEFSNDTTLSGVSPSAVPTEYAVKTYVDSAIVSGGGDHNNLLNIQGGIPSASEYYHLSQSIHDALFSASPTIGMGTSTTNITVDYGNDIIDLTTGDNSINIDEFGVININANSGGARINIDGDSDIINFYADSKVIVALSDSQFNIYPDGFGVGAAQLDLSSAGQRLGDQSNENIFIHQTNNTITVEVSGTEVSQWDGDQFTITYGGTEQLTVGTTGIAVENGVVINEFSNDITLSDASSAAVPTEYAVYNFVGQGVIPQWNPFSPSAAAAPTLVLNNGLYVNIVDVNGTKWAAVRASDVIASIITNDDPPYLFGINKVGDAPSVIYADPRDAVLILDCTDQSGSPVIIEVWIQDNSANSNYVETFVAIQDNDGICI